MPPDAEYVVSMQSVDTAYEGPALIDFDAELTDRWIGSAEPGELIFRATNTAEEGVVISSGVDPPFGLIFAHHTNSDLRFLLWRDYDGNPCVSFTDDGLGRWEEVNRTALEPGDSVSKTYELLPATTKKHPEYTAPPTPGTYSIDETLNVSPESDSANSKLTYGIRLRLEAL